MSLNYLYLYILTITVADYWISNPSLSLCPNVQVLRGESNC